MFVCMYVCMYACMYVCMYGCMDVWMYVCAYVCWYECMYVCMNEYVCIYNLAASSKPQRLLVVCLFETDREPSTAIQPRLKAQSTLQVVCRTARSRVTSSKSMAYKEPICNPVSARVKFLRS